MFTRVRGNTIQFAMPLQGKTFFAGGIAVYDFVPAETDVITVVMQDRKAYTYTPTVRSNMLLWTDDGNLDVGMYSVEVIVNREDGTQLRCLRINQVNIVETNAESELDFPMVNNSTDETVSPADAGTEETEETVASGEETPTRSIASSDFEETAPSYESDVPLTDGPNERFYPKDVLSAGVFIFAGDGTLGIREIAEGVFDSRIIDVEDRLIHDYTSKIAISARELRSDYEEQIYDAKGELTEAYQSEILQTARQISLTVESYKAESDGHYSELSSELLLQSDRIETKVSQEDYDENNILIEERFSNVVQTSEEIRATVVDNKRETDGSIRNLQSQLAITASEIAAKVSLLQYNADKHETDAKFGELIVRSDQISAQVIANKNATDGLIQGLERRLTIDENGISTLVADLNIVGRQVTVAQSEIIQLANSIGLKVNQSDYNVDKQAILQRIASLTVDVDGVHAEVSRVESTVDTHTQTLAQYALDIQDIQNQIDGAIDTWFYDYPPVHVDEHGAPDSTVPLITDSQGRPVQPYYDWYYAETQSEPEKVRDMHLGDIFYDNASGYAYRFEGTGQPGSRVYSWITIQDSAVITALQNAAQAQDTADHKRRVFVTQPYGPYDVGDLWVQGHNNTNDGAIFRCQTPTAIPDYFAAGDWVPAADYESVKISRANFDVFADAIVGTVAQYDSEGRITSEFATRIAQTIDSISFSVAKVGSALLPTGIDITNQQIVVTASNFMIRDNDSNVALITEGNKIKAAYLEINGIFSTAPGSVWMTNVNALNSTALGYANTAENNAKGYADTGDTNTLNSAKSYADTVAETAYDDALDYVTTSVIPGVTQAYTDAINALGIPDLKDDVSGLSDDLDAAILRIQATEGGLSDLGYLSAALLNGQTVAVGGLVLSSLIQLGSTTGPSSSWQVWSGINGVYNSSAAGNGIAAWYGGAMLDRYYSENTDANRAAKTLFRMDGSGYLASNNLWWGASGELHISQSTIIGSDPTSTIDNLISAVAQIASWFEVAEYTPTGGQAIRYLKLKTSDTGIRGFATDGFITAGGIGPESGGGGGGGDLNVNTMYINLANGEGADPLYFTREINVSHLHEFWKSLQNNDIVSTYDNYKIAGSHIPDMAETYGYLKSADIDAYLQSLQSQIDSVASRDEFDELTATVLFADMISTPSIYVETISLNGSDLAGSLSNLSSRATSLEGRASSLESRATSLEGKFTGDSANSALRLAGTSAYSIWGVEYWSSGVPKSVTGRPGLFVGSTQVQTSSATQDLAGIGSITATGALTLSSTKKIYFGDSAHYIELDADGYFHFSHGLYSEGFVTAGGQGTGGGGGGGLVEQIYRIGDFGDTFDTNANDTFNAYAINSLHLRIASLEQDHGVTSVGLSMPTGFSVSGTPITASGTFSVSFASGYSLLTSTQISTWNGKQDAIIDLPDIRTNAANGATAYSWGNHANAGYFAASSFTASNIVSTLGNTAVNMATADAAGENIASNFTTVGNALKSLQSQIDSVASRSVYDELTATNLYSDMAVGVSAYFSNFYGNLAGTASNATNADNADKLDGVHASGLFTELTTSAGSTNLYITIGGTRLSKTVYAYYDSDGGVIASNMTTIGTALRSLQSQIDSVATNRSFDEISITSAFVDMLSVGSNANVGGTIHSIGGIDSDSYITAGATGSSSDARFKDNIVEVSAARALQLLSALKGKEWTWNEKKDYLAGKHGSGLIAQEVLPVMPWAVLDLNGEYSLNYNTLWGVAIPVMQSHEQRIEALERENKELKRKIEILTNNS